MAALILTVEVALESCFTTSLPTIPVAPVIRIVLEFLLVAADPHWTNRQIPPGLNSLLTTGVITLFGPPPLRNESRIDVCIEYKLVWRIEEPSQDHLSFYRCSSSSKIIPCDHIISLINFMTQFRFMTSMS